MIVVYINNRNEYVLLHAAELTGKQLAHMNIMDTYQNWTQFKRSNWYLNKSITF